MNFQNNCPPLTKTIAVGIALFTCCAAFAQQGRIVVSIEKFGASSEVQPYIATISFEDMVKSELGKIGKIEVAKRDDLRGIVSEIQNSQSGLFDKAHEKKLGGFKSAAKSISGQVTMLERLPKQGMRNKFTLRANVKIADIETATESAISAEVTDFAQSPSDLLEPLAKAIARKLSFEYYPVKIAAVVDDTVILNYGKAVFSKGDVLGFYENAEITDPDTGVVISRSFRKLGTLTIVSLEALSAVAKTTDGSPEMSQICKLEEPGDGEDGGGNTSVAAKPRAVVPTSGNKPTIYIGKFKYSNEFDLSQTSNRGGRPITTSAAGGGSGALLGAIAGGLLSGSSTKDVIVGTVAGAAVGGVVDSERRQYEHGKQGSGAADPYDQRATAIEKESPVLREMTLTKMHKSGKFTVVEQARKNEIKSQMDNEMDGDFDEADLITRGKMKSAKYSVFGTITRFQTDRTQKGNSIFGGKEDVMMTISLDMRLIDNELGTIICSDEVTASIPTHTEQSGFMGFGTATENQGAIGDLLKKLSKNIVFKIATTLWPVTVISDPIDGVILINVGDSFVEIGDILSAYSIGDSIVDPTTGEILGASEKFVGNIRVCETLPGYSKCKISSAENTGNIGKGFVCRPAVVQNFSETVSPTVPASPGSSAPPQPTLSTPKFSF